MADTIDDAMDIDPATTGRQDDTTVSDLNDDDNDSEGVSLPSSLASSTFDSEDEEDLIPSSDDSKPPIEGGIHLSSTLIPTTASDSSTTTAPGSLASLLKPQKPIPYTLDAGNLLISDPNPLPARPPSSNPAANENILSTVARDAAQTLLNTLLTTCPITTTSSTSNSKNETASGSGVLMTLPSPQFELPREKRVPERKEKTKWERFAEKKGIGMRKREGRKSEYLRHRRTKQESAPPIVEVA